MFLFSMPKKSIPQTLPRYLPIGSYSPLTVCAHDQSLPSITGYRAILICHEAVTDVLFKTTTFHFCVVGGGR